MPFPPLRRSARISTWANRRRGHMATRLQRAWRRRRYRGGRRRGNQPFARRVLGAVRRNEMCQYSLFGEDARRVSISPVILNNFSALKYTKLMPNAKYIRTANKVYAKTLTLNLKVAPSDEYNLVCIALVRYKRSDPMTNADLQDPNPITLGPLTTSDDKPFMPCQQPAAPHYTQVVLNMRTNAAGTANPFFLQDFWNPKVVDVIKKWNVTLQANPPDIGVTYPFIKSYDFVHRFNEQWKYAESPNEDPPARPEPYNNKNYYLVAWSDSKIANHPFISWSSRLSFKDVD